jgi:hypothetical protein
MVDIGYYLASSNVIGGSVNPQNLLSIENPTGSTVNVVVKRITVSGVQSALSALVFSYHVGRTTAKPTAGTVLTAQQRNSADAAPTAVVRTGPTATAAAGQCWALSPQLILGLTLSGVSPFFDLPAYESANDGEAILLAPGEGMLVSVDGNLATWNHTVRVFWGESNR